MARVNRPRLLLAGLFRALAGVFATGDVRPRQQRHLAGHLHGGPLRDAVFTLLPSAQTPTGERDLEELMRSVMRR
ncbi:hypothetical protein ACFYS7_40770 [Streptomyces avermitilis]|uniref:hypothetical protein n=1 Tax=Streptomyces avermitilis TaxID=33903 RepID=UPI003678BD44